MLCALDSQNRLLGWAGFEHVCKEGSITNVAVEPAARRSGIGQALVERLIKEAENLSLESLILEVRVSNSAAIALYSKLGFVSLGIRPGFYEAPREDALMMRKTLQWLQRYVIEFPVGGKKSIDVEIIAANSYPMQGSQHMEHADGHLITNIRGQCR